MRPVWHRPTPSNAGGAEAVFPAIAMVRHPFYAPSPALRPFIRCIQLLENTTPAQHSGPRRVTPDGCTELNFNLGDPVVRTGSGGDTAVLDPCYVVARHQRSYHLRRTGVVRVVSVRFQPWGLRGAAGVPAQALADGTAPGEAVFGASVHGLQERLALAPDMPTMLAELDRYFLPRLHHAQLDPLVVDIAQEIERAQGRIAIGGLPALAALSLRRVQQRFKERMGLPPKAYARLVRFQHALAHWRQGVAPHDVVFASGYADQAHFVHEFTQFAGISPTRYRREAQPLNDAMRFDALAARAAG